MGKPQEVADGLPVGSRTKGRWVGWQRCRSAERCARWTRGTTTSSTQRSPGRNCTRASRSVATGAAPPNARGFVSSSGVQDGRNARAERVLGRRSREVWGCAGTGWQSRRGGRAGTGRAVPGDEFNQESTVRAIGLILPNWLTAYLERQQFARVRVEQGGTTRERESCRTGVRERAVIGRFLG